MEIKNKTMNITLIVFLALSCFLITYQCLSVYYIYHFFKGNHPSLEQINFITKYFSISMYFLSLITQKSSIMTMDILGLPYLFIILLTVTPVLLFFNKKSPILLWMKLDIPKRQLISYIAIVLIILSIFSLFAPIPPSIAQQLLKSYADFITWFRPLVFMPIIEEFIFRVTLIGGAILLVSNLDINKYLSNFIIFFFIFLSAALETTLHLQYDWMNMLVVFITFCCAGYIFYRSKNILVAIGFHSLINIIAMISAILLLVY